MALDLKALEVMVVGAKVLIPVVCPPPMYELALSPEVDTVGAKVLIPVFPPMMVLDLNPEVATVGAKVLYPE